MYSLPKQESFDKYDEYRLHMETLMSAPLVDFDLPVRTLYALGDAGIKRLRDLCGLTKRDLLKINRINLVSVKCIEKMLADQGLETNEANLSRPHEAPNFINKLHHRRSTLYY